MKKELSNLDYFIQLAAAEDEARHAALSAAGSKGWRNMWRNRRARAKARRQARRKAEGSMLDRRKRNRQWPIPGWQVLVTRCEPDRWHSWHEIRAMLEHSPTGSVKSWLHRARHCFERAQHPDFDVSRPSVVQSCPTYLYRLTPEAARLRQEWRKALWEYDDTGI